MRLTDEQIAAIRRHAEAGRPIPTRRLPAQPKVMRSQSPENQKWERNWQRLISEGRVMSDEEWKEDIQTEEPRHKRCSLY